MIPGWKKILLQFEVLCSQKQYKCHHVESARRLVRFLKAGSFTFVNEEILMRWMQKRLTSCTLECMLIDLTQLKHFILFLEQKDLCSPGLLRRLMENSNLLLQLQGSRRYRVSGIPLGKYWQELIVSFEASLRGFAPLQTARMVGVAIEFAHLLQKKGVTSPDEGTFLEWLDKKLSLYCIDTVVFLLPHLDRFCQFLMEKGACSANPVRQWRQGQWHSREALLRRREGKPPKVPSPEFQSVIAPLIYDFIAHKRSLGRKYEHVPMLKYLDRYLLKQHVENIEEVDERLLLDFLTTCQHWQASTRKTSIGLLNEFFRYLERRGEFSPQRNPAKALPRVVRHSHIPFIFSVKNIVDLLSYLRNSFKGIHDFDRHTVYTLFYLIYACGLRISEARRLQVRDVNLTERTLFIRQTKFGKDRLIPFGRRAGEYLSAYHRLRRERLGEPQKTDPFFVQSIGRPYSRGRLQSIFSYICEQIGLCRPSGPKPRVHDLRHSFTVHRLYKWYLEGADPQERLVFLSIYLGHVDPKHTEHYLHISEDLMRIAGRPLEKSLDEWLKERQVFQFDE